MKNCPNCNGQVPDNAAFCPHCGMTFGVQPNPQQAAQPNPQQAAQPGPQYAAQPGPQYAAQPGPQYAAQPNPQAYASYQQPPVDIYDHTSEFTAKDISDNKVVCMLIYLLGPVGILIALLCKSSSPYVEFHLRQGLKMVAVSALLTMASALLFITIIVPIAALICLGIIYVLKIICFFQICQGKAKEPAIIRNLNFLK